MHKPAPQELRTFFVTFVTAGRRPVFQVERNATLLIDLFASHRTRERYQLHAWVIMPDHIHLLLTPSPKSLWKKRSSSSKEASPSG